MTRLNRLKSSQGITLIALVVTIVILLILSGVTINMLLGEDGIIRTAQEAKNTWEGAVANEQQEIQNLVNELNSIMNGGEDETPTDPEEIVDITTVTEIVQKEEGQKAKDTYGNVVVVPKGFKVVTSEATTVPEGIVIEDGTGTETTTGNQFVWIPVGTVHKDNNPENDVTIKLGRYTFDETNGNPTIQQAAFAGDNPSNQEQNYEDEVTIPRYYQELTTYRAGTVDNSNHLNDLNATAKNLAGFVQSVADNGGYYIARYEASYESGSSTADWKPLSKVSTGTPRTSSSTPLTQGMLWNYVTQLDASKISQNMYPAEDTTVGVESDLVNSYAWDTAIVFIQSMNEANSNYANKTDGNGTLKNTGETGDEVCNIYDMAANVAEWTTEYCTRTFSSFAFACTYGGGDYSVSGLSTADRLNIGPTHSGFDIGFRVALYVK